MSPHQRVTKLVQNDGAKDDGDECYSAQWVAGNTGALFTQRYE